METVTGKIVKLEDNIFGTMITLPGGREIQADDRDTEFEKDYNVGDTVSITLFDKAKTVLDDIEYRMASKIEVLKSAPIQKTDDPLKEWMDKHVNVTVLDFS